jgi:hypothetical protein
MKSNGNGTKHIIKGFLQKQYFSMDTIIFFKLSCTAGYFQLLDGLRSSLRLMHLYSFQF